MKINRFLKQFNWRFLLVRIVVNALALAVTAAVTPKIYFADKSVWSWLLMALMLGVLNALLKPLLQFLTLQFIFVTYGLVVVLVNALLLWLLSLLFPARFAVDNLLWALAGGLVLGLVSSFLESLLGLTMPIVDDEPPGLRDQLEEQVRHVDWSATAISEALPEEHELTPKPQELQAPDAGAAEPSTPGPDEGSLPPAEAERELSEPDASAAEPVVAEPAAAEPSTPGPDGGPSPPAGVDAEGFDAEPPAEEAISIDPEPAPESQEEAEEDPS
jgi:putative membrane protein